MPITQNRMLALAYAARDYRQALRDAVRAVKARATAVTEKRLAAEDAIHQLAILIDETALLEFGLQSSDIINMELRHFETNMRRNQRAKEKQARRREAGAEAGKKRVDMTKELLPRDITIERRTTAPDSLLPSSQSDSTVMRQVDPELQSRGRREPMFGPRASDIDLSIPAVVSPERRREIEAEAQRTVKEMEYLERLNPDGTIRTDDIAQDSAPGPSITDSEMEADQEGIDLPGGESGDGGASED